MSLDDREELECPEDIRKELRELMELFDFDDSKTLNFKELVIILRSLGMELDDVEVQNLVVETLQKGETRLTLEMVEQIVAKQLNTSGGESTMGEEELEEAFRVFDKDQDGKIGESDLAMVMMSLGETLTREELEEMMVEARRRGSEADEPGVVTLKEFISVCRNK